jgi:F0F1-type ATP synthase alpha subunit
VVLIYAANEGFIDKVPVNKVFEFEAKFMPYLRSAHAELLDDIRKTKDFAKPTMENLKGVLKDFVDLFLQGKTPDPRTLEKKAAAPAPAAK